MTTRDEGFGRLEGGLWRHWPAANSTISDTTTFRSSTYGFALLVDRDRRKWVGCWDNALESFHDDIEPPGFTHWWTPVPVCPNNACDDTIASHTFAWAAALDSSGGHWFGMDSPRAGILGPIGLDHYGEDGAFVANYNQNNTALRDGRIHALTVDSRGRIWVGYAGKGLDYFDWPPDHGGPAPLHVNGVGDAIVAGLAATRDGIWVLTAEDLLRVGLDGDVLGSYELPGAVADLALNPIDVAPDGRVWVGTAAGIRVFRTEGMVADYTASNSPLADDQVRTLRIDRATGVVWIGTPSGINRLDPAYVPPAPVLPRLEVDAFPNPARLSALGSGVRLIGNVAELRGEVYDLTGRLLHRFRAAAGQVVWNGTGPDGRVVKPGIYFIRAEANGRSGTVRVALVR
jgi:hypothetical protein